jgi:hypothetical protein
MLIPIDVFVTPHESACIEGPKLNLLPYGYAICGTRFLVILIHEEGHLIFLNTFWVRKQLFNSVPGYGKLEPRIKIIISRTR